MMCVCVLYYLAGRKSSSTVDVSVKVKGRFRHAPKAETKTCRSFDLADDFLT